MSAPIAEQSAFRRFSTVMLYGILAVAGGFVGGLWAGHMRPVPQSQPTAAATPAAAGTPAVVKAHEFVVVDSNGKTRATLSAESAPHRGPALVFDDPNGQRTAGISGDEFSIGAVNVGRSGITVVSPNGQSSIFDPGSIWLTSSKEQTSIHANFITIDSADSRTFLSSGMLALHEGLGQLGLSFDSGNPTLSLTDAEGRERARIGAARLKDIDTGDVIHRSPASLVLFKENGRVLWEAP